VVEKYVQYNVCVQTSDLGAVARLKSTNYMLQKLVVY